jgi:hypothetical protein
VQWWECRLSPRCWSSAAHPRRCFGWGTASVVVTAQPTAEAQPIPEGVVASGAFNSADGSTTGTVDVVVTGNLAELVLRDLVSTHERLGVRARFGGPPGRRTATPQACDLHLWCAVRELNP